MMKTIYAFYIFKTCKTSALALPRLQQGILDRNMLMLHFYRVLFLFLHSLLQ